jgi:molecular chaperone HtpG
VYALDADLDLAPGLTRADLLAAMQGGMGAFYANMPDEVTLTVNGNHPVYKKILSEEKERQEKLVNNLADLALLSQGLLKGNTLTNFINRSVDLMNVN